MRYFITILLSLCLSFSVFSQSATIEKYLLQLPKLSGTQKVDALNSIARDFIFKAIQSDSALRYASMAEALADSINYPTGKARALITQAETHGSFLGDFNNMISFATKAINTLKGSNDLITRSHAHRVLGIAYTMTGQSSEAPQALAQAIQLARRSGNDYAIGWANWAIGFANSKSGNYWKAFEHLTQSAAIGKQLKDSSLAGMSLAFIARGLNHSGDAEKGLSYYYQCLPYMNHSYWMLWPHIEDIGLAYLKLKQYDSALYYQQLHRQNILTLTTDSKVRKKFQAYLQTDFTNEAELGKKNFSAVIASIQPKMNSIREKGDHLLLMNNLLILSRAYEGVQQYKLAIPLAKELVTLSESSSNNYFRKEAYHLMSSLYDHTRTTDSAYAYYRKYIDVKEIMDEKQFSLRADLYTATIESEKRIQLLNSEKQSQQQQLASTKDQLQQKSATQNILLVSLGAMVVFVFLMIRNNSLRRKNDQLQHAQQNAMLQKKTIELEMQALRAQMNPHLIFNCLSAIDNLVQTNQTDKATLYLARFAKLIRTVLDSSRNNLVPFQKDYEAMQLYLEMEQFRCNNKFRYDLHVDEELLYGDYKVPPLIIQPFIENAIHHGLLNKQQDDRQLHVTARLENDFIVYSVTDNGIGRDKAQVIRARNKPGHQSYGIGITRERISLHNSSAEPNDISITDIKKDGQTTGTCAVIRISKESKTKTA